jgi:transcription initiation factor TFIID TATA-box-binding protein
MIKAVIVNVVVTANLCQEVDLLELREFHGILHDSNIYGGRVAYFKVSNMEGKVSIFTSGKMISVGTRSEKRGFEELQHAMNFLVEKGLTKARHLRPQTQNIVVSADIGKVINLEKMASENSVIYEPEQFPAGILRVEKPHKATILVFSSGKLVLTGLRKSSQIRPVLRTLANIITPYTSSD